MKTGGYGRKDIQFDMLHQSIIVQRLYLLIDMGVILGIETLWVVETHLAHTYRTKFFAPLTFVMRGCKLSPVCLSATVPCFETLRGTNFFASIHQFLCFTKHRRGIYRCDPFMVTQKPCVEKRKDVRNHSLLLGLGSALGRRRCILLVALHVRLSSSHSVVG